MPFQRLTSSAVLAVFSLCLGLSLTGCGGGSSGPDGKPRISASGKVELDGQPIPAGTVTFSHVDTGNMAICEIDDGYYESNSGDGPNPGNNLVLVEARESADGNPMWAQAWTKNVQVGDSDFTEDFAITSSEVQAFDPASRPVDVD